MSHETRSRDNGHSPADGRFECARSDRYYVSVQTVVDSYNSKLTYVMCQFKVFYVSNYWTVYPFMRRNPDQPDAMTRAKREDP